MHVAAIASLFVTYSWQPKCQVPCQTCVATNHESAPKSDFWFAFCFYPFSLLPLGMPTMQRCFYVSMAADYQLFLSVPRGISTSVIAQCGSQCRRTLMFCTGSFYCFEATYASQPPLYSEVLSLGENPGVPYLPEPDSNLVRKEKSHFMQPSLRCCRSLAPITKML